MISPRRVVNLLLLLVSVSSCGTTSREAPLNTVEHADRRGASAACGAVANALLHELGGDRLVRSARCVAPRGGLELQFVVDDSWSGERRLRARFEANLVIGGYLSRMVSGRAPSVVAATIFSDPVPCPPGDPDYYDIAHSVSVLYNNPETGRIIPVAGSEKGAAIQAKRSLRALGLRVLRLRTATIRNPIVVVDAVTSNPVQFVRMHGALSDSARSWTTDFSAGMDGSLVRVLDRNGHLVEVDARTTGTGWIDNYSKGTPGLRSGAVDGPCDVASPGGTISVPEP